MVAVFQAFIPGGSEVEEYFKIVMTTEFLIDLMKADIEGGDLYDVPPFSGLIDLYAKEIDDTLAKEKPYVFINYTWDKETRTGHQNTYELSVKTYKI